MKKNALRIAVSVAALSCLAATSWGYSSRLLGMNSPTLSQSKAAAAAGLNVSYPTDEFGLGVSAVPDTLDIWKLPARLADLRMFNTRTAILEYVGPNDGNVGLILSSENASMVFGVFTMRPDRNGWVTGGARQGYLGADFETDAAARVTAAAPSPVDPANILDLMAGFNLNNMSLGVGLSYGYGKDDASTGSVVGTGDTDVEYSSDSSLMTLRAGASFYLQNMDIDLGLMLPISGLKVSYVSGTAAGDQNDTIEANNTAFNFTGRMIMKMQPDMNLVALVDYVSVPQKFSVTDDGAGMGTNEVRLDDSSTNSFGLGAGVNWAWNKKLFNILLTAAFGGADYTNEGIGVTPRPEDKVGFTTLRLSLNGEHPLSDIFILRGGLGGSMGWRTVENNVGTGGFKSKTTYYNLDTDAAAGLGVKVSETVELDFVLNLNNFTTTMGFGSLSFQAGMNIIL